MPRKHKAAHALKLQAGADQLDIALAPESVIGAFVWGANREDGGIDWK